MRILFTIPHYFNAKGAGRHGSVGGNRRQRVRALTCCLGTLDQLFGTLFLRDLYDCPIINYFEWFYRPGESEMDFRPEFPTTELSRLRSRARNAMLLLDLDNCDAGYSPTAWQRSRVPKQYHDKVRVIFDGVDTELWRPGANASGSERRIGEHEVPDDMRIVTYVRAGSSRCVVSISS